MKTYKYHYVYRITNLITAMHYYGDRSCNCHPSEDIGIKYFSTNTLKLFIQDQKNNPQDYKYKVVRIYETTREGAKQLEVDLHKKFDVKNHPKFINRANQTSAGFDVTGYNFVFSDTHKDKISKQLIGIKRSSETKKLISSNHADVSGSNNPMFGKGFKNTGKNHYLNMMSIIDKQKWIKNNLVGRDRKFSEEAKINISNGAKNRKRGFCPHCFIESDMSNLKRYHFDNCSSHPEFGELNTQQKEIKCSYCDKIGKSIEPMKQ